MFMFLKVQNVEVYGLEYVPVTEVLASESPVFN